MDDRGVVPQPRTGRVLALALATAAGGDQGHAPGMIVVVVDTEPAAIHDLPMMIAVVDAEAAAIHGHPMMVMVAGAPLKTNEIVVDIVDLLVALDTLIAHILAVLGMRTVDILNILHSMILNMAHLAILRLIYFLMSN